MIQPFMMIPLRLKKNLMKEKISEKTLVIITGPTAVGKTSTSIEVARRLGASIISADARQFYRELKIGTAAPTQQELQTVKHHLVGHLSIHDYYNASLFEQQALQITATLFNESDHAVVCGGAGLYIDALLFGIDDIPDVDPLIRKQVQHDFSTSGLEGLRQQLQTYDPEYYSFVDTSNPNRMMRGIEVFLSTGIRYSQMRKQSKVSRPFNIKLIVLNRPRHELTERINIRTQQMLQQGIVEEAIDFFRYRHLNSLNTVGYKELFAWLNNTETLKNAMENIKTNTRRYAKRQVTWFKKYEQAKWFLPSELNAIMKFIQE
jgi:tRNA dimethylallyltransferase